MLKLITFNISFFDTLMRRQDKDDSDILKIIFPGITEEDIEKYNKVQEDII
jgi:hypothetical protein